MQNTLFEPTNLPEIANPSFIEQYLFESSTASALVILGIAALAGLVLKRSPKPSLASLAFIFGTVCAVGVFVLGRVVVTPREHIADRIEQLVASVVDADAQTLSGLVHESVRVRTRFGGAQGRDQVVRLSTSRAAPAVESARVSQIRVGLSGPRVARSTVKVKARSNSPLGTSIWMIDWSRPDTSENEWVVTHIEPVWIQGIADPAGP